jgi:hypothetical protein
VADVDPLLSPLLATLLAEPSTSVNGDAMESFSGQSVVKMSLFCSMKEGVSYLYLSAATYLLFCHVQPPPRSAVPHGCCRPSNGRKMQALTAVEWLTAVRDRWAVGKWLDRWFGRNRLTGLGAGLPLTTSIHIIE